MNKENKGITCNAENCVYHNQKDKCTAEHINVGCVFATNSSETKCETFECNSECK